MTRSVPVFRMIFVKAFSYRGSEAPAGFTTGSGPRSREAPSSGAAEVTRGRLEFAVLLEGIEAGLRTDDDVVEKGNVHKGAGFL